MNCHPELPDDAERRLDLIDLTEAPHARLLQQPLAELNPVQIHAVHLLRLLESLDQLDYCTRRLTLPGVFASTPIDQCVAIGAALEAIEAPKTLRAFKRIHHLLGFDLTQPPCAERALRIVQLETWRQRLLERLIYEIDEAEVERQLWCYLRDHPAEVQPWSPSVARTESVPHIQQHSDLSDVHWRSASPQSAPGFSIFILEQRATACTELLNAWLAQCGQAMFRQGKEKERRCAPRDWSRTSDFMLLAPATAGCPPVPSRHSALDQRCLSGIAGLATSRDWVLVPWPNTMHESALALLTADPAIAGRFDALLQTPRFAPALLSCYLGVNELESCTAGAQFGESDGFGEIALVAAQTDGVAPWLVLKFFDDGGHWWRSAAAGLPCLEWRRGWLHGQPQGLALYRAEHPAAYRQLWSRLGDDRNVAVAAVSGLTTANTVLDCMQKIGCRSGFRQAMWLSRHCGWSYMHMWGGGSDEHHAMFHARDPALTNRIYEYAASQQPRGWYLAGRW